MSLSSLELLDLEAGGQGLLQLLGLLLVLDDQGVEEPRATNLGKGRNRRSIFRITIFPHFSPKTVSDFNVTILSINLWAKRTLSRFVLEIPHDALLCSVYARNWFYPNQKKYRENHSSQ
jgi:hypothetical protein